MGALGALILALANRKLSYRLLVQALEATTKLSSFVVFILIGARVFSLTFYGVSGHVWVENWLISLPGGQLGFLLFVNALVFVLAFFLDFFELAFIIVPLLAPAADKRCPKIPCMSPSCPSLDQTTTTLPSASVATLGLIWKLLV